MIDLDITLVIQMVSVLILFIILSKLFFKPILTVLNARKAHVDVAASAEEEKRAGITKLTEEYDKSIADARLKAAELREEIKQDGLQKECEMIKAAQKQHSDAINEARLKAKEELDGIKKEIAAHAKTLSVNVAEKILQRKI